MSGIGKTDGRDLSMLEELSKMSSGTIRLDEKGKGFKLDDGMTFRSGMRRLFGQEKSEGDIQQNQRTLEAILAYVERNTSKQVFEKVMGSGLRLSGDKDQNLTVTDRLERGTYVSPKMVSELLQITRNAIAEEEGAIEEENRAIEQKNEQENTRIQEKMRPFQDESRRTLNTGFPGNVDDSLERMRDESGIKDDYTWQEFKTYVDGHKDRVKSSFDEEINSGARWDRSLTPHDVKWGISNFVSKTLLPEFLDSQPVRKSLDEMNDDDIAKGVRTSLQAYDSRHVDSFINDLLTKKEDDDDMDTRGMVNMAKIRESLAGKMEKEGRGAISGEELVGLLDPRMVSDMLSEHVRRG